MSEQEKGNEDEGQAHPNSLSDIFELYSMEIKEESGESSTRLGSGINLAADIPLPEMETSSSLQMDRNHPPTETSTGIVAAMEQQFSSGNESANFKCTKCGKVYLQYSSLQRHNRDVHTSVRIKCDKCHYKTSRKDNLLRHYKLCHTDRWSVFQSDRRSSNCGKIIKFRRNMHGDPLRVRTQEQGQQNRKSSTATVSFASNGPGTSTNYQLGSQRLENQRETPGLQISEVLSLAPRVSVPMSSPSAQSFPPGATTMSSTSAAGTSFLPTAITTQVAAPRISPLTAPAVPTSFQQPRLDVTIINPSTNIEGYPSSASSKRPATSTASSVPITTSPVAVRNSRTSPFAGRGVSTTKTVPNQSGATLLRGSTESGQPRRESPSSTTHNNTPTRPSGSMPNTFHRLNLPAPRKSQTSTAPGQSGAANARNAGNKYATVEETRITKYYVDGRLVRKEEDTVRCFKQIPASWDNGKDIRDQSTL